MGLGLSSHKISSAPRSRFAPELAGPNYMAVVAGAILVICVVPAMAGTHYLAVFALSKIQQTRTRKDASEVSSPAHKEYSNQIERRTSTILLALSMVPQCIQKKEERIGAAKLQIGILTGLRPDSSKDRILRRPLVPRVGIGS